LVAQAETADWAEWHRDYLPPDEEPIAPVSDIYYPIVEELNRVEQFATSSDSSSRVVAVLMASFYWREMLHGILPTDSNGIVLVVRNPCNQDFTYQIDGQFATYLGVGDHHDTGYDSLAIVRHQADLKAFNTTHAIYSGAPMDTDVCPFLFHVYPSATMQARYTSKNPIIFTAAAIMIFAFTSLVFYLYDKTVENRQRTVLRTATQSSAIVSSLFPAAVRDQLYDQKPSASFNLESFLRREEEDRSKEFSPLGQPIAELYNDTTVFFADIAGFTAWSSQRTPTEVFHLLETLYCAFDAVAKRRRVFKVETIGDSYVAVVGLPTPRERHAEVMVRFAVDCLQKMGDITRDLADALGPVSVARHGYLLMLP
jgi:Adenylate and Guanylate cyclase catalytic domain